LIKTCYLVVCEIPKIAHNEFIRSAL